MLTNVYPNYEPKTDWDNQIKKDLNIRDLQSMYPNGCICCGNIYPKEKFSVLVSSHFRTKKHMRLCLEPANEQFKSDFRSANDMNVAYEEACRENRKLKKINYELFEKIKHLEKQLTTYRNPETINLIDLT